MEVMVLTTLLDNMWCVRVCLCVCVDDNREGNKGLPFLPSFSIREVIMYKCVLSMWTQYVHYMLELLVIRINYGVATNHWNF